MIQAHSKLVRFLAVVAVVSQAFLPFGSASAQSLDRFYENSEGPPHLSLINGAEKTLELEVYTLKSTKIMNALKKAMERGVKLSIVQDPDPVDVCKVFYPVGPADDAKCQEMLRSARQPNEHVRMDAALKFGSIADQLQHIHLP